MSDDHWEDVEAAKTITGKFANRVFVQPLWNGMVRINFGEVLDEFPSYHTAIVVRADQAVQFAQVIYGVTTEMQEAEQAAAIQRAEAAAEAAERAAQEAAGEPSPINIAVAPPPKPPGSDDGQ